MGKELLKLKEESKIKRDNNIVEGKEKLDFNDNKFHDTWKTIKNLIPMEYSNDQIENYGKSKYILPTFKKSDLDSGFIVE